MNQLRRARCSECNSIFYTKTGESVCSACAPQGAPKKAPKKAQRRPREAPEGTGAPE